MLLSRPISYREKISDFYFAAGERERSAALLLELTKRMETVVNKNEWDLETAFALADTYEKIGDYRSGSQSLEFYKKSNEIWNKYQQNYTLLSSELFKMDTVRKKSKTIEYSEDLQRQK